MRDKGTTILSGIKGHYFMRDKGTLFYAKQGDTIVCKIKDTILCKIKGHYFMRDKGTLFYAR